MAKIERKLGELFKQHSNCTSPHYNGKKIINKAAMTKEKFVEIVSNLLTERMATESNSENTNCSIFELANKKAIEYAKLKHGDEYNDPAFDRDIAETEIDFARGFMSSEIAFNDMLSDGFRWQTRYSQNDKPDKQGRWARLCFYRNFLISWISRKQLHETDAYVVRDFFPSNGNSDPCFVEITEDFEKAKEGVEKRFIEFIKHTMNLSSVVWQRELLAFKQFISKTPLAELELYSDEEFTDFYIKSLDNSNRELLISYTKWLRQRSLYEGNFTEQQLVDAYNKEFKDIKDLHSKDK